MNTLAKLITAAALALSAAPLAFAAQEDNHSAPHAPSATLAQAPAVATSGSAASMSEGVVRKIDKSAGKITIKHGALKNLGMPAMTMVFRVQDPAMLDQAKEGDKINFVADKVEGLLTVTQIEVQQ